MCPASGECYAWGSFSLLEHAFPFAGNEVSVIPRSGAPAAGEDDAVNESSRMRDAAAAPAAGWSPVPVPVTVQPSSIEVSAPSSPQVVSTKHHSAAVQGAYSFAPARLPLRFKVRQVSACVNRVVLLTGEPCLCACISDCCEIDSHDNSGRMLLAHTQSQRRFVQRWPAP